jgi:hypothetical protein
MPNDDVVVADKDPLDDESYDSLSFDDIERGGGAAQAREERRECFCKAQEIGAVVGLIGNRLQFRTQRLFALP